MISKIKQNLFLNIKNIPGWKINRKIVVIECDDFGGQRMPSKEVCNLLIDSKINITDGRFNQFDTLEREDDLNELFEVLLSVKDINGKPAVLTPITNLGNPDFKKIKESEYREYHYEKFTETLSRVNGNTRVFKLWQKGMEMGIFTPESHGREHISVQLWLKKLQEGDKKLRFAFDHEFVAVSVPGIPEVANQFRPEFYFDSPEQKFFLHRSIKDGINLFENIFGYIPHLFVPTNSLFHQEFEKTVHDSGVHFLNVGMKSPFPSINGKIKYKYYMPGQHNADGLTYYTRNCAFEPTDKGYKGIDLTLAQMSAAFRWYKPAIISSHRVNFVGGLSVSNRDKGLRELKKLLDAIVIKWPDVEFMSSGEFISEMCKKEKGCRKK